LGLHTYTVSAVAIGAGGSTSDVATNVEVLATYNPPADLIAQLTTGKWRVPIEDGGHMGVGPYEALLESVWWTAGPFDKSTTGMNDDRYTFNADGTFTFDVGADFEIFGKGYALETDFGGLRIREPVSVEITMLRIFLLHKKMLIKFQVHGTLLHQVE